MKNILFFNTNKAWGGGEKWHFNTAVELQKKGYKCQFITYPGSKLENELIKANILFHAFKVKNLSFMNPILHRKLRKVLKGINPSTIFLNLPSDVKLCAPIASRLRVPQIIYRRGMPHPLKNTLINRYIYSKVTHFIANSQTVANSICKNIPELKTKIHVIYNSSDLHSKPEEIKKIPFVIGNLARLVEQKGQEYLIELARELSKRQVDYKIIIAGDGPLKEKLAKKVCEYNLDQNIKLIGHIPAQELFRQIHFFAFPSLFEGMPNALIESYSYGIPAIAFNISSMPEVISHNIDGYLIDDFNIKEMADCIEEIIANSDKLKKLGKAAQYKVKTKFNQQIILKQIEELIHAT